LDAMKLGIGGDSVPTCVAQNTPEVLDIPSVCMV
jgi:hypothetical protein